MAEQPAKENTKGQDINITGTAQDTQTTQDTHNTQQTSLTQEFLAKLGLSAASTPVGSPVGQDRGVNVLNQQTEGPLGVGQQRVVDGVNQQQTKPEESESQTVVVDCRYCGGCCGGRRGRRLPRHVVGLVRRVKELLGLRYECEVLNEFPELFCVGSGRGHGLNRVKELERLLSREGQYKGSYLVKRLGECSSDVVCAEYVRLGVEGWVRFWFHYRGRALGENVVENYLGNIAKSLGFNGIIELARFLRLVVQGLIIEYPTDRHAGYKDVLDVGCGLCGESFRTTIELPAFIVKLVRHFQVKHGLRTVGDVKSKVEELMVKELDKKDRPKAHPALRELISERLLNVFVGVLVTIGLLEEVGGGRFKCVLDGVEVDGVPGAVAHVLDYHNDVIRDVKHLLKVGGGYGGEGSG
jgi:hypothetical protein